MIQHKLFNPLAVGQVGRMTREDRKDQVFDIVRAAGCAVTVGYVAQKTGLKVTPYLQSILAEMAEQHDLERDMRELSNGIRAWAYDIPQELK